MTLHRLLASTSLAVALAIAPLATSAQPRAAGERPAIRIPESSLRLLIRSREELGLSSGQVLTLELKDGELQMRTRELVAALRPGEDHAQGGGPPGGGEPPGGGAGPRGAGMGAGGMGPPGGGGKGPHAGAPDGGAGRHDGRTAEGGAGARRDGHEPPERRVLAEIEALDRNAERGIRRVLFTEPQQAKVDALLARRAELLSRGAEPRPVRAEPAATDPEGLGRGAPSR